MVKIEIQKDTDDAEDRIRGGISNGKSDLIEEHNGESGSIEETEPAKENKATPRHLKTSTLIPNEQEDKMNSSLKTSGKKQLVSRKFDPKKPLPQGPFAAHKVKYNSSKTASGHGEIEWPKDAKFFELVEVYLPSLEVPDHVKRSAKLLLRKRRWKKKKKKQARNNNTDKKDTQDEDKDVKDAEIQTEPALDDSLTSTKDILLAIESLASTDLDKPLDAKADVVAEKEVTSLPSELGEDTKPEPLNDEISKEDSMKASEGCIDTQTGQNKEDVSGSDSDGNEDTETSSDEESDMENNTTDMTEKESTTREDGAWGKSTTLKEGQGLDSSEEEQKEDSDTDDGSETEPEEDTEDKASQAEGLMEYQASDNLEIKSTSSNDKTLNVDGSDEQPPPTESLTGEEQTTIEVRQMYKEEVIQLFNQMDQFRIQCNKESAKYQKKMERNKRKVVDDIRQLKRERDGIKAKLTIDYIKEDTDLIRKKDDLLKKGSWILEMEEKLKNRKETLKEWEEEMDEIEGYLTRRYEFAKRKEENLADVDIELRKLRDVLDDEKAELEKAEMDPDAKRSKKAKLHWDFVQKATLEKEQLLELAIERHKKRAKALQEQLGERGVHIENQDKQLSDLTEELAKKEQKIKELDAHLSIVLQESMERDRELDYNSQAAISRGNRGSSLRGFAISDSITSSSASVASPLTRSKSYPVRGKTSQLRLNNSTDPMAGYSGEQPSGYRGGKGTLTTSVTPIQDLPRARHDPNDTKIEFNSKGAGMSRMCRIM